MVDASSDILADIENCISSPSTGMGSKKVSKLLLYPWVRSRWFYCVKGEEVVQYRTLPQVIIKLGGMKSFENLNKTDMVFSSSEVKDMEIAVRTLHEVTSWMDWWFYVAESIAICNNSNTAKVKSLIVAGSRTRLLVTKIASTIWTKLCSSAAMLLWVK